MEGIFSFLEVFGEFLVAVLVLGAGTERGTQLVKEFFNWLFGIVKLGLKIDGRASLLLSAFLAMGVAYFFKVDVLGGFEQMRKLDPELLPVLNALLFWLVSNKTHDKYFAVKKG